MREIGVDKHNPKRCFFSFRKYRKIDNPKGSLDNSQHFKGSFHNPKDFIMIG